MSSIPTSSTYTTYTVTTTTTITQRRRPSLKREDAEVMSLFKESRKRNRSHHNGTRLKMVSQLSVVGEQEEGRTTPVNVPRVINNHSPKPRIPRQVNYADMRRMKGKIIYPMYALEDSDDTLSLSNSTSSCSGSSPRDFTQTPPYMFNPNPPSSSEDSIHPMSV